MGHRGPSIEKMVGRLRWTVAAIAPLVLVACTSSGPRPDFPLPPEGCRGAWTSFSAPSPGNFGASLVSISVLSATDAWAVGRYETVPKGYSPPPPTVSIGPPP